jgi:hypothetical protein
VLSGGSGVLLAACLAFTALSGSVAAGLGPSGRQREAVPERVPRLGHVVVVVLENKQIEDLVGSSSAPAFNRLLRAGAAITNYYGVTHPSLPNYLALVSGSTHGITSDCTSCSVQGPSIATSLPAGSWRTYAEGLPAPGWTGPGRADYAKKHNPLVYFREVASNGPLLRRSIRPLRDLAGDVKRNALPRFALVVPDLCHDMHSCDISTGDRWLGRFVTPLLRSRALGPRGVIFVVFDEGQQSNHVPALAIGPAVRPGSTFDRLTDHYGLLRTIEQALDLPLLGRSAGAQAIGGMWRSRLVGA